MAHYATECINHREFLFLGRVEYGRKWRVAAGTSLLPSSRLRAMLGGMAKHCRRMLIAWMILSATIAPGSDEHSNTSAKRDVAVGPPKNARKAPKHGFLPRVYQDAEGRKAKYMVFVPHIYRGDRNFPLILFLHGKGESGTDGEQPTKTGLGPVIRKNPKEFRFFAVFPQSQHATWKAASEDADRALAILEEVEKEYKIDSKRIYLTGVSMGGLGTWSLAEADPNRWAAIVPICGGLGKSGPDPSGAAKIKDLPCWCFHGDADKIVPARLSQSMIGAIKKAGGHPAYTEYPGVDHQGCWVRAYRSPDLYKWLLKHRHK